MGTPTPVSLLVIPQIDDHSVLPGAEVKSGVWVLGFRA